MELKLSGQGSKGQLALNFLVQYGWAFLLFTAVIASFVYIDPLGIVPNTSQCSAEGVITCEDDKTILGPSGVEATIENPSEESVTITDPTVDNVNGDEVSEPCSKTSMTIRDGEKTIRCTGVNTTPGQENDVAISYDSYETDQGRSYESEKTLSVSTEPVTDAGLTSPQSSSAPSSPATALASMSGNGTEDNPYVIMNDTQLQAMEEDLSAHYVLGRDIDASGTAAWNGGKGFNPIGTSSTDFTGSLNGKSFSIKGLTVNRTKNGGLFRGIDVGEDDVVLERLSLSNVNIDTEGNSGGLVANMDGGIISDVTVNGRVEVGGLSSGSLYGGGIVAYGNNNVTIRDSSVDVKLRAHPDNGGYNCIGGLSGGRWGYSSTVDAEAHVDTYINGSGFGAYAGPISGCLYNSVKRSSGSGEIVIDNFDGSALAGGLTGVLSFGKVTESYATTDIDATSQTSNGRLGGLTASLYYSTTNNTFVTGDVNGNVRRGSYAGRVRDSDISNSYAVGEVNTGSKAGGLNGYEEAYSGSPTRLTGVYWDNQTTQIADRVSDSDGSTVLVDTTDLTTSQMQGSSAASNMVSFDFTDTWTTTSSYPELTSN